MEIIIHRVNTIKELKKVDQKFGAEIDVRAWRSDLILTHEPFQEGEKLENYLDEYHHGTLVLNIKEAGIENEVLRIVRQRPCVESYFLLDVEFPYLYQASRNGERNIAVRFSEDESIKTVEKYVGMVNWVWIDTNTCLPISDDNKDVLDHFKTCLVCPERWGRPQEISYYIEMINLLKVRIDSVMTSYKQSANWCNENN